MTRILVTGASGLLGLNLALEAAQQHTVIGVTHSRALTNVPFETVQADLLVDGDVEGLLDQAQPDRVIHCAALATLDDCERQPQLAHRLNAELPGRLAAMAAQRGLRFLHLSTEAIFDGEKGTYVEEDAPNPLSVYARTKLAGEEAVLNAHPGAIVLRTVFFGWSLSGRRSLAEHFYNRLSAGKTMPGHADRVFSPLLVNTLAGLILEMLEQDLHGLFHCGSADRISKYEFGLALADRFGLDGNLIQPIKSSEAGLQAARSPDLSLRSDKLAAALGRQLPTVADGLQGFYQLFADGYPTKLQAMAAPALEES